MEKREPGDPIRVAQLSKTGRGATILVGRVDWVGDRWMELGGHGDWVEDVSGEHAARRAMKIADIWIRVAISQYKLKGKAVVWGIYDISGLIDPALLDVHPANGFPRWGKKFGDFGWFATTVEQSLKDRPRTYADVVIKVTWPTPRNLERNRRINARAERKAGQ